MEKYMLMLWGVVLILLISSEVHSQSFCRDLSVTECRNINPHHCYERENRELCCATCRRWRRPSQIGCEYGDRSVIWKAETGKYTCTSYIAFFSAFQCRLNPDFRRDCCRSCAEALAFEEGD